MPFVWATRRLKPVEISMLYRRHECLRHQRGNKPTQARIGLSLDTCEKPKIPRRALVAFGSRQHFSE